MGRVKGGKKVRESVYNVEGLVIRGLAQTLQERRGTGTRGWKRSIIEGLVA